MATSEVSIANLALSLLGEDPIISLTEDTSRARTMNLWYEHARDAVLADHLWNSNAGRQQISADAAVPPFGFSKQFQLPSDFLRLAKFNDGKTPFRIEGKKLLANVSLAKIRYHKKITDPNMFEPMLVDAIAARLAKETAIQITGDPELKELLKQDYKEKLQSARGVDAQQGPVETFEATTWTDARLAHNIDDEPFRFIEDS